MFFQILSHAGMQVRVAEKTLIFDPWLIGSTYWRSWWNYPPPDNRRMPVTYVLEAVRPQAYRIDLWKKTVWEIGLHALIAAKKAARAPFAMSDYEIAYREGNA